MAANDRQVAGDHYRSEYQHWDFCWRWDLDSFQYPATKYLARFPEKDDGRQELEKVCHYLEKYLECLEATPARVISRKVQYSHFRKWEFETDLDHFIIANNIQFEIGVAIGQIVLCYFERNPEYYLRAAIKTLRSVIEDLQGQADYATAIGREGA